MTTVGDESGGTVPNYERAYGRLTEIVTLLESGDLDLERSLSAYEEGVKLARYCQGLLENAELRVRELSKGILAPFASATETDGADEV